MPKFSGEGLVGIVLALLVVILEQAGVRNRYVLWGAFALALGVCIDAVLRSKHRQKRKLGLSLLIMAVFGGFGVYLHRMQMTDSLLISAPPASAVKPTTETSNQPPRPPRIGRPSLKDGILFMDCQFVVMPSVYPPSGHVHVLVTSEIPGNVLANYLGPPNGTAKWNNTGNPEWAYRCEVANCTDKVLINVEIPLHVAFRMPIPVPESPNSLRQGGVTFDGDWRINVPKIDSGAGAPFVFFIWNCCVAKFVQVTAPNYVTAGGPSSRKQVPLVQSTGNLFQAIPPARNLR